MCLGSVSSVVLTGDGSVVFLVVSFCNVFCDYGCVYCCDVGVFVLFCNSVLVYTDVCCVSSVVEEGML